MDITGKIIWASQPRSGVSQRTGNSWKSQDFVIEFIDGQYPRHCMFTVFGEDRLNQMNLQIGSEYTVSFDIDAHEYNGRWFNDLRAWRATPPAMAGTTAAISAATASVSPAAVPPPTAPTSEIASEPQDDLPF